MPLNNSFYFLSPVEVVRVTIENVQEAAAWCAGEVLETESRRVKGRMDKYVLVPTPKGTKTSWAFPGMFITKRLVVNEKGDLKATFAVFRRDYFEKNYFGSPTAAVDATWEREVQERQAYNILAHGTTESTAVAEAIREANHKRVTTDASAERLAEELTPQEQQNLIVTGDPDVAIIAKADKAGVNSHFITQRELDRETLAEINTIIPVDPTVVDARP